MSLVINIHVCLCMPNIFLTILFAFPLSLSDVCNSTDLPEVEIISLLEEQLPHYKLRADTIYGYDHDDWLHTPLISPDVNLDLTTEQIEETLKYFRKHRIALILFLYFSHFHSLFFLPLFPVTHNEVVFSSGYIILKIVTTNISDMH